MKIGNRVTMAPMWKYEVAYGKVIKINKEYVVVRWDGVNGDWHYTHKQAERIEVVNEKDEVS